MCVREAVARRWTRFKGEKRAFSHSKLKAHGNYHVCPAWLLLLWGRRRWYQPILPSGSMMEVVAAAAAAAVASHA